MPPAKKSSKTATAKKATKESQQPRNRPGRTEGCPRRDQGPRAAAARPGAAPLTDPWKLQTANGGSFFFFFFF